LGKGAYAVVKNAVHKQTNKKMAIKIYEKFRLSDPQRKSSVNREIVILKKIDHPNIVKLFEVIDSKKEVVFT
jgi:MAP/microtubule affinity-regulating kinase